MTASAVTNPYVGRELRRKEDRRLITGKGQYIADLPVIGGAAVGFVRSSIAHGRIRSIETEAATALPGVIGVFTGAHFRDQPSLLSDPLQVPRLPGELRVPDCPLLAVDEVKFHGDPIAVVIAEDRYVLYDAMETIYVEYEPLPVVLDPEMALESDAPLVYPEWGDNLVLHHVWEAGDVEAAFAAADLVVSGRYEQQRSGGQPMETRGCIAAYDSRTGLDVYLTTQRPHIIRNLLSRALRMPYELVHLKSPPDIGGGFGTKAPMYREEVVICLLARELGRPLRWLESREEHLLTLGQERGQIVHVELALKRDGTVTGFRDVTIGDCGDSHVGIYLGVLMPFVGASRTIDGYDFPNVRIEIKCVATNKASQTPSRGFGRAPTHFAVDRALDKAAHLLKLDPLEVKLKNVVLETPHTNSMGVHLDSADLPGMLKKAAAAVEYDTFRDRQRAALEDGRYIGIGFGLDVEPSGVPSSELVPLENQPGYGVATVMVDPAGTARVVIGDAPHGQGAETMLCQVVAGELGLLPEDVALVYGDTEDSPFSAGTVGDRTASYTVSAAVMAARIVREKMTKIAKHLLALPEETELRFAERLCATSDDSVEAIPIARIADVAWLGVTDLPPGVEPGLRQTSYFESEAQAMHSTHVHAAVVEVVPETGNMAILQYVIVDDAGVRLNPLIVRGQIQGGFVMGLGSALFEEYVYDDSGQQLTTTFMDYHLPSALDVPPLEIIEHDIPTPFTPLGSKGKGEGAPIPVPTTLAAAVEDALTPFGVEVTETPLKPEAIWRLLKSRRETAVSAVPV